MRIDYLKKRALGSALAIFAVLALALAALIPAKAQVPSSTPPYNVDLGGTGSTPNVNLLIKNTAAVPGTIFSAQQNNLDKVGVVCVFNQTASSGSPTVNFAIQNYDAASQQYYTLVQSGVVTPLFNQPFIISVKPGDQASSLPSNWPGSVALPLSRFWRVQQTLAGSNTTSTGSLSCNVVK